VVAGDALGNLSVYLPAYVGWSAAAVAVLLFLARWRELGKTVAMAGIVAAASLPAYRLHQPSPDASSLRRFPDRALVTIEGRILAPPEHLHGVTHLFVTVERAGQSPLIPAPAAGLVRVTLLVPNDYRVGDEVRVAGRIRFPYRLGDSGEFDYQAWLERRGISATLVIPPHPRTPAIEKIGYAAVFPTSQVEAIRDHIRRFIATGLRYPESAEMMALVIGDRGGIDEPLRQRFALTGMAHLLVISGLHLSFVALAAFGLARLLLGCFPPLLETGAANKLAALFAAIVVSAYSMIAGHHVSTLRALVMVLSYVLAVVADRGREVLASLALAAIVICLLLPGSSAEVGFQLSFASVCVIVLGMRRFMRWWSAHIRAAPRFGEPGRGRDRIALIVAGYFAVSFWALLGTAPLTAFYFNQFSIVGLVANAVVVPIMGLCGTVCGLLAALMSFVSTAPAYALLTLGGWMLQVGTWLAGWFLSWPLAWMRVFTPTVLELVIAYAALALWLGMPLAESSPLPRRVTVFSRHRAFALIILLMLTAGDAGWWSWDRYFHSDLRVTFLSVGEGDAAVVRFPGSRVMLIDAGGSFARGFDPGERIVAPFLWSRKIMHVDYLALSHPDLDHFGGFEFIVRNFSPTLFWMSGEAHAGARFAALMDELARRRVSLKHLDAASAPLNIGGVTLRCLGPEPGVSGRRNNVSMVLRLSYGPSSLLFAGDLEAAGERALIESRIDLRSSILKVPHHGSSTSSSAAFLGAVDPELAVVSLGYLNRYNFPSPEVIARYHEQGVEVLRTDENGAIEVDATRRRIRLHTFRDGWLASPVAVRRASHAEPRARASVDRNAGAVGRFPVRKLLPGAASNRSPRRGKLPEEMHG
jgi:competence protein ComEC